MKAGKWKDKVLRRPSKAEREAFLDSLPTNEESFDAEKHCLICGWPINAADSIEEIRAGRSYKFHPDCFLHGKDELEKEFVIRSET